MNQDVCILIIHRLAAYREGVRNWLCNNFKLCNLFHCGNYDEAVKIIEGNECIKLLIGDFEMGNGETNKFLKHIRKNHPHIKSLCVISLTDAGRANQLLKAGYENIISESCTEQKMLAAIEVIMNEGVYFDHEVKIMITAANTASPALTEREKQILDEMTKGISREEICKKLIISPDTLKTHLKSMRKKLDAHDDRDLVLKGLKMIAVEIN